MTGERVAVCTTLAAYVMDQEETWSNWLLHAEEMCAVALGPAFMAGEGPPEVEVGIFAALQVDSRGLAPFRPLLDRLAALKGDHWTFSLDDGRTEVTTDNRLRHITMGQNLCSDYATSIGATHMLFLAADLEPPADAIKKLLEVGRPLVGGEVPTYCFDGPSLSVPMQANIDLYVHMPTAAFVMVERELFKRIKWRWDADLGMTDDPCFAYDAEDLHGVVPVIRRDCVGRHHPEAIPPIEERGHDRTVHR